MKESWTLIKIHVDADACPVKAEVARVAARYGFRVDYVANSRMAIPDGELFELVVVAKGNLDAADDWIAERVAEGDIVVSSDIPLASRCLARGARVLDPKGRVFTPDSIGEALASREISAYLREIGDRTRGPAPFEKRDRSRFLERLDSLIQASRARG
ncbi:MAG: YaiI/YqxD family protein [Thermoanaerobaculia bacterium]